MIVDPFGDPTTAPSDTVSRSPTSDAGTVAVFTVRGATPIPPKNVSVSTSPLELYVVHDQSVSPVALDPAVRPITS